MSGKMGRGLVFEALVPCLFECRPLMQHGKCYSPILPVCLVFQGSQKATLIFHVDKDVCSLVDVFKDVYKSQFLKYFSMFWKEGGISG